MPGKRLQPDSSEQHIASAVRRGDTLSILALSACTAIAAMFRFVAMDNRHLQPRWLQACALVSLTFALVAALFRTIRSRGYGHEVCRRLSMEAMLEEQQGKQDYFLTHPDAIDPDAGDPTDVEQWAHDTADADRRVREAIHASCRREMRLLRVWCSAEYLCRIGIGGAMASLAWLAFRSF